MRLAVSFMMAQACFGACATSWGNGYSKCVEVTLDHTKIPNTDQTSFPNMICFNGATGANCDAALGTLTLAALKGTGSGGSATSASCFDCAWYSDNAGTTLLKWDTDVYVSASGSAIFHVKKTRSHTVDDKVYLFIGNASVTTFQGDESMWTDAGYVTAHHLSALNGTTLSGVNSVTGTRTQDLVNKAATATTGMIGGGVALTTEQYMAVTVADYPTSAGDGLTGGTEAFTISFWVKTTQNPGFASMVTWGWDTGTNQMTAFLENSVGSGSSGFGTCCSAGYVFKNPVTVPINDGNWHYFVGTSNAGSTVNQSYIDGVFISSTPGASFNVVNSFGGLFLGRHQNSSVGASNQFIGSEDEVRIATSARSADWIASEYNNQGTPSTFYSAAAAVGPVLGGVRHRVIM